MMFDSGFLIGEWHNPDDSDIENYIDSLYQIFLRDLVYNKAPWKDSGLYVSMRRYDEVNGRHAIFWHIITGGSTVEENRILEEHRCVRLGWILPLILKFNNDYPEEKEIRWWIDARRSSHPRYIITKPEYDYVVVVEERSEYALLVTAYYIEREHRRRKLRNEHDRYWSNKSRSRSSRTAPDTPSTPG